MVGVLIVNLGTPDDPGTPSVRKYLREFLMDGRVIDIPYLIRYILVKGIIAPFRAPKSAKIAPPKGPAMLEVASRTFKPESGKFSKSDLLYIEGY